MKGEKFLSLPVLGVLSLMLFVYYTTIFIFLDEWLGLRTSPGTLNFFFFTLIASLSLFSFFLSVLTDPGHVPSSFYPDVESSSDAKDVSFFIFPLMGFFLFSFIFTTMLLCFLLFGKFNFMFLDQ
jgi:hypothetical protein